jgi:hypothetical protein
MLAKLKSKGISYLYILDEDYKRYLILMTQLGDQLKKKVKRLIPKESYVNSKKKQSKTIDLNFTRISIRKFSN